MVCIKCKQSIPDGSAFCNHCGAKQSAPPPRKAKKRANGMGTVYKRPENCRLKWVTKKNGVSLAAFETKAEALKYLESRMDKPVTERETYTVQEVYDAWKAEHFRELTTKGVLMYEFAWLKIAPVHTKRFRSLRVENLQAIVDDMIDAGLSRSSTDKVRQLCGQLYKWAMREDIVDKNIAQFVKLQKDEKTEKAIFSPEDIAKLERNLDDDGAKVIWLLIYSGMRVGELFSLKKSDVHLNEGYMIGGEKTAAGRDRIIPITDKARPVVEYLFGKASDLLIDGYSGPRKLNSWQRRGFSNALNKCGITTEGLSTHSTRHTFASLCVNAGVKPEALQKIIGHADYNTTATIYVHADAATLVSAVKNI